jgi:glutamine amidotransferase
VAAGVTSHSLPRPRVVVLDYGSGNLHSAARTLAAIGADVDVTADRAAALSADALVVPGVGAFAACMASLRGIGGPEIIDLRLAGDRPVLGICVGMQVMFDSGVEHGVEAPGCGQWPGSVVSLRAPILPHMGWNTVRPAADSAVFAGVADERFYFVHSFGATGIGAGRSATAPAPRLTWCDYGGGFLAAVEDGPLVATQFHPEKSGDAGLTLLENWLATVR